MRTRGSCRATNSGFTLHASLERTRDPPDPAARHCCGGFNPASPRPRPMSRACQQRRRTSVQSRLKAE
ncbi:hypothetical protein ACRAWD_18735 [Caulobacter segnis]